MTKRYQMKLIRISLPSPRARAANVLIPHAWASVPRLIRTPFTVYRTDAPKLAEYSLTVLLL